MLLADGTQIPIEDVAAGDVVMATDPITGVTSPQPVTDLIRHLEDHAWVSVTVVSDTGSEILEATGEHPFFVTTAPTAFYPGQVAIAGGWVNAADLTVGDVVRTAEGGTAVVAGVTVAPVTTDTLDWAFNLTIANAHTYYVGEQPVLVHNAKFCEAPSLSPVWNSMKTVRPGVKVAGRGRSTAYHTWDHAHGDIEVFSRNGQHLGSMHPFSGAMHKPPVRGRRLGM